MQSSSPATISSFSWLLHLLIASSITLGADHAQVSFVDETLSVTLPEALSDHTASRLQDQIFIAGGCNNPMGNVFDTTINKFVCPQISTSLHIYDIAQKSFVQSLDLPIARFRHAAVAVNNEYLVISGGRNVTDSLIPQVDIFSVTAGEWITITDLDDKYVVSDHAGFAHDGYAYFVGGYNTNYEAQSAVIRFHPGQAFSQGEVAQFIEVMGPLVQGRGDLDVTTDGDVRSTYAIVSGGFTDKNNFTELVAEAEKYNFSLNSWTDVAPLNKPRADMVLVEINGLIFAMGGERQLENVPDNVTLEPGELTIAVNDVELLDIHHLTWEIVSDELPQNRFRFAAVGFDTKNEILTFGGQKAYDRSCQCFPTTKDIILYTVSMQEEASSSAAHCSSIWSFAALQLSAFFFLA